MSRPNLEKIRKDLAKLWKEFHISKFPISEPESGNYRKRSDFVEGYPKISDLGPGTEHRPETSYHALYTDDIPLFTLPLLLYSAFRVT